MWNAIWTALPGWIRATLAVIGIIAVAIAMLVGTWFGGRLTAHPDQGIQQAADAAKTKANQAERERDEAKTKADRLDKENQDIAKKRTTDLESAKKANESLAEIQKVSGKYVTANAAIQKITTSGGAEWELGQGENKEKFKVLVGDQALAWDGLVKMQDINAKTGVTSLQKQLAEAVKAKSDAESKVKAAEAEKIEMIKKHLDPLEKSIAQLEAQSVKDEKALTSMRNQTAKWQVRVDKLEEVQASNQQIIADQAKAIQVLIDQGAKDTYNAATTDYDRFEGVSSKGTWSKSK